MADKSIGDLVAVDQLDGNTLLVCEQTGTAKQFSGGQLTSWLLTYVGGRGGISDIEHTGTSGLTKTYTIHYVNDDATDTTFDVVDGRGISTLTWEETGESGNGRYHVGTFTYNDESESQISIRDGLKGDTGDQTYVHIRYSEDYPNSWSDTSDEPNNYIGIYTGTSADPPTTISSYDWFRFKGNTGIPGQDATIAARSVQYAVDGQGVDPPSSGWSGDIPQTSSGQWLWTKVSFRFSTEAQPIEFFTCARNGSNGLGSVSTVNDIDPVDGNVTIGAGDINYEGAVSVEDKLDALTAADQNLQAAIAGNTALKINVTLNSGSWSSNQQVVQNVLFEAGNGFAYFVEPAYSSREAYKKCGVSAGDITSNGSMTFNCLTVPSSSLSVNIVRMVMT